MTETQPPDRPARAIRGDGGVAGWLTAPPQEGDMAMGVEIVLYVAVQRVAEALSRAQRAAELPTRSRLDALTDLLASTPKTREQATLRVRSLGFPVDSWHVVVRLDFEDLSDPPAGGELAAYDERVRLGAAALRATRTAGGTWHEARTTDELLLIRSYQSDPGPLAAREVAGVMETVLVTVREKIPTAVIRCGVGMAAAGASGLLASSGESKAAVLAGRTGQSGSVAVAFDNFGLRRTLVEWYASDTAREAATAVLAPLSSLGGVRAERLIQTLHVYLDERGSLTRTAQRMNLHRNAVAYRVNRAFELLEVDRESADDLLLLQLACRARDLS
jgi:hypothetical protein